MDASLECLAAMCARVHAAIQSLTQIEVQPGRHCAEAHIRPARAAGAAAGPPARPQEARVAFAGDTGAGKSTLIAVLQYGQLDNGRGEVRLSLLRHRHEILSGRTSSVAIEPLVLAVQAGALVPVRFDALESTDQLPLSSQRLMLQAPKVLQLFDLPPRFHRSALLSLTSVAGPDVVCVVASCADGLDGVPEYLALARALGIPALLVLSQTDLLAAERVRALAAALAAQHGVPVFPVSTVTGAGIPELLAHLAGAAAAGPRPADGPAVFAVESVKQCERVGTVLKGALLSGQLDLATPGWVLGPAPADGAYAPVTLASIHRLRLPVQSVEAGMMAAVAIDAAPAATRGMLLMRGDSAPPRPTARVDWPAPVLISGRAPDKECHGVLHCGCARVAVRITPRADHGLRLDTADEAQVLVQPGVKLVLVTGTGLLAGRLL